MDSLKRKFKELHLKRIPTGDPNCPPAVCHAKRLRRAIIDLMDGSDMNSPLREDNGDDDESTSKSSSSGGDEFPPGDIHFDDNVGEDENTDDANGGGGIRPASRVSGTAAATCPASRASLTDADAQSSSRPSGTAAGSDEPIRGEGEDVPVLARGAQRPPSGARRSRGKSSLSLSVSQCSATHLTPISMPRNRNCQREDLPEGPGHHLGNVVAMMMMTHASDRDERQEEREERRQEFHLQIEMQHQQMQAQQNMMTMIMITMMGWRASIPAGGGIVDQSSGQNTRQHNEGEGNSSRDEGVGNSSDEHNGD